MTAVLRSIAASIAAHGDAAQIVGVVVVAIVMAIVARWLLK